MSARELVFDIFAIDRASAVFGRVGSEAMGMGGKVSKGAKVLGGALETATLVVGGLGYESVKTADKMEAQMQRISTTSHQSASEVKKDWAAIDKMAGVVGLSVTSLADALYYISGAGFKGADGIKVLQAAAEGSKVDMANVTDVGKMLAGSMVDFHLKASDAVPTMNAMNAAVGESMTSLEDFAAAWPSVGTVAGAAGITLNETAAAMATLASHGLPAANAATYLRQTIGHLEAPSAKARKEMQGLGIDANQLALTMTSGSGHGLGDAIEMIYNGITNHLAPSGLVAVETFKKSKGSASDFQKMLANLPPDMQTSVQAIAEMSGGVKGFQGIITLGSDGLAKYKDVLSKVNGSVKEGGKDVYGFAKQQQTLQGKLDDVKGAFSGFSDELGQKLLPVAKHVLDWLTKAIRWMAENKTTVMVFAGTVVGLGIAFTIAANPIILVIAAIAALAAGVVYAYKHSQTFRDIVSKVFHAVGAAGMWLWNNALKPAFHWIAKTWDEIWPKIKSTFESVWNFLQPVFAEFGQILGVVLPTAFHFVAAVWSVAWSIIKTVFTAVWDFLSPILKLLWAFLSTVIPPALTFLRDVWMVVWDVIKAAVQIAWALMSPIIDGIGGAIDGVRSAISVLGDIWGSIWAGIQSATQAVAGVIAGIIGGIATAIENVTHDLATLSGTAANVASDGSGTATTGGGAISLPNGPTIGKNARGTDYWRGGLTWVGEEGPELVNLPTGSKVTPAGKSRRMSDGPLMVIENYNEARQPVSLISADLAFRLRSA